MYADYPEDEQLLTELTVTGKEQKNGYELIDGVIRDTQAECGSAVTSWLINTFCMQCMTTAWVAKFEAVCSSAIPVNKLRRNM